MPKRHRPQYRLSLLATCIATFTLVVTSLQAFAVDWPQEIEAEEGTIIIYQPQPDELEGNLLTARAAMSIELKDRDEPIFGAMWLTAKLDTDRATDTATVTDIRVSKVVWPDSKDNQEQRFTQVVETAVAGTELVFSLTDLSSALAVSEQVQESLENLNTDPPVILFEQQLAVLLLYDGEPRFSKVEGSGYERALNTPLAVVKDDRTYYLTSGNLWYQANDPLGPWQSTANPPANLAAAIPRNDDPAPAETPVIVTATQPTELIVSQGKPSWASLQGGKLLYVENTETPWVRDLASGSMYVQLSGRWFRASSEEGPWDFVRADKLPEAFSEIPPASDIGGVRSSVAGTDEANEALADAHIPQTAVIKRSEASLTVNYDGNPKFKRIEGTDVAYAVNTEAQVLLIDGRYYAADNGVWFTATDATGPWQVADTVPTDKLAQIPPSSPVYNTTYVTIYDSTPDVVYVGYTPGYLWSYPYYGVPVYGTGWYYPPYWGGGYYYPRTPTWGFHVGYNPWTGWNFGVSWGGPFLRVGVSFGGGWGGGYGCCGGWYGGGYRHNDININTGDINIGNNVNIGNRRNDVDLRNRNNARTNLYERPQNRSRNADPTAARANLKKARSNPDRANNLYADRNGQIARREGDRWEVREDNQWRDAGGARDIDREAIQNSGAVSNAAQRAQSVDRSQLSQMDRPNRQSRPQFDRQRLNRDHHARQRAGNRRRR